MIFIHLGWVRNLAVPVIRIPHHFFTSRPPRSCHGSNLKTEEKRRKTALSGGFSIKDGRSGETRTRGLLLPKQARYQLRNTPLYIVFCFAVLSGAPCFARPVCALPLFSAGLTPLKKPERCAITRLASSAAGGASAVLPKAGALPTAQHPGIILSRPPALSRYGGLRPPCPHPSLYVST